MDKGKTLHSEVVEAFIEFFSNVPCCGCCGGDEGYMEYVGAAWARVAPFLTDDQRKRVVDSIDYKPFLRFLPK